MPFSVEYEKGKCSSKWKLEHLYAFVVKSHTVEQSRMSDKNLIEWQKHQFISHNFQWYCTMLCDKNVSSCQTLRYFKVTGRFTTTNMKQPNHQFKFQLYLIQVMYGGRFLAYSFTRSLQTTTKCLSEEKYTISSPRKQMTS